MLVPVYIVNQWFYICAQVNISFTGNRARIGVAVFSTSLAMCPQFEFISYADSQVDSAPIYFG